MKRCILGIVLLGVFSAQAAEVCSIHKKRDLESLDNPEVYDRDNYRGIRDPYIIKCTDKTFLKSLVEKNIAKVWSYDAFPVVLKYSADNLLNLKKHLIEEGYEQFGCNNEFIKN